MGELRKHRPWEGAAIAEGYAYEPPADETGLREEHSRLRAKVATLRKERAEGQERLEALESENRLKDQALSEQLAVAKVGPGVAWELFDGLRLELQELLQSKRKAQETRVLLQGRERQAEELCQELRPERIPKMEQQVTAAKVSAKAKARRFAELGASGVGGGQAAASQQHQQSAKKLVAELTEVEGAFSRSQRCCAHLQDERARLEQAVQDNGAQAALLREKHAEIERQQDQCRQHLVGLSEVQEEHRRLVAERRERLAAQKELEAASRVPATSSRASSARRRAPSSADECEASSRLFAAGFRPLRSSGAELETQASRSAALLLWRFRRALELRGRSGLEVLAAADKDGDGRVSAPELVKVFQQLAIPFGGLASVQQLMSLLSEGLAPTSFHDGLALVDLIFALPSQQPPLAPTQDELAEALRCLAWACRRRGIRERDVRRRIADWLVDPCLDLTAKASSLCAEVGLRRQTAAILAGGLEAQREHAADLMPSWRFLSSSSSGKVLQRFVRDVKATDAVWAVLAQGNLQLEDFVQLGLKLGRHWCREDLEHVALLVRPSRADVTAGAAPLVDGPRLARASASPTGFAAEFPALVAQSREAGGGET